MCKMLAGFLLIVTISTTGFGQNNVNSWQNLQQLKAGDTIRVVTLNSPDTTGKYLRSSADEMFLEVNKNERLIKRADVQRVDVKKGHKRLLHALIGAGIGAAAGLAVFSGANSEDAFYGVALPLFPVLVGGGAVTGSLVSAGYSTVYKTP